jgi:RimJ/RimL family protein N-acetyltransferase/catechol 2,3-dioxygenase-like lactoylglutathione lyase family enzyme
VAQASIEGVRFGHANLIARDWRRLARFYTELFGCVLVPPERDYSGPVLERGTGIAGAALEGAHLRLPGFGDNGPTLEIFTYSSSPERSAPAPNTLGFGHIAFQVASVPGARDQVIAAGGVAVGEVVTSTTSAGAQVTWCYVTDPEGNILELQSWMPVRAAITKLVPQSREDARAMIDAMSPAEKEQLSPEWLAQFRESAEIDPWIHGFRLVHRDSGIAVGSCMFKGPPTDGAVEIAYGIDPAHQGKGYATEATQGLVEFALNSGAVRLVLAHTLPQSAASRRVLAKCGFEHVGDVIDPEDGLVCRFEKLIRE